MRMRVPTIVRKRAVSHTVHTVPHRLKPAVRGRRTRLRALFHEVTDMIVTPAHAQAASGAEDFLFSLVPLIAIFAIMYFLLIRPQQQKLKTHKAMVDALRRGDQVVTQGGVIGKVVKVRDEAAEIDVEIAEGVRVRVVRATIASVVSKTEPAD